MRFIVLLCLLLLNGCSSILQHKLEHYKGLSLTGDVIALGQDKQFCSDNHCISYLDLSSPSYNGPRGQVLLFAGSAAAVWL